MSIGGDTLVTKNLQGISLRSALKLLLDEMGLKYVIHNEVLLITSPTKAESEEFLITKFYDVSDLLFSVSDYPYRGGLLPGGRAYEESNQGARSNADDRPTPFVISRSSGGGMPVVGQGTGGRPASICARYAAPPRWRQPRPPRSRRTPRRTLRA